MSEFNQDVKQYRSDEPITPYQKAAQVWDLRMGALHEQARKWQAAFWLAALTALILAGLGLYLTGQSQIRPYVVEVEKSGRVVNIAPLTEAYQPDMAQIRYYLGYFVKTLSSVPADPVLMRRTWEEIYRYVTPDGAALLTRYVQENQPFNGVGQKRVSVTVNHVLHLEGDSYQVQWQAREFDANGKFKGKQDYTGLFLVYRKTPHTRAEITINPLGIYIHNFEITPTAQ